MFSSSMNGVPFRGLIRSDAMRRAGPLRHTPFQSAHEEFVWLAKLAREGMLGRVEGPLYYKRKHEGSLSPKWHLREPSWKRAVWIEFGIGMLEAMMPLLSHAEHDSELAIFLERLCCPRDALASTTRRPNRSSSPMTSFVKPAHAAISPRARTLRISASSIKRWGAGLPPRRCRLPTWRSPNSLRISRSAASLQSTSRKAKSAPGCFKMAGPFQNRGLRGAFRMCHSSPADP